MKSSKVIRAFRRYITARRKFGANHSYVITLKNSYHAEEIALENEWAARPAAARHITRDEYAKLSRYSQFKIRCAKRAAEKTGYAYNGEFVPTKGFIRHLTKQ